MRTRISKTIISGHFSDNRIRDTVWIYLYEQRLGNTIAGEKRLMAITNRGDFHFKIPLNTELSYIKLISNKKPNLFLTDYLLKKRDSIHIEIDVNRVSRMGRYDFAGLRFTGKNCQSFTARYNADSAYFDEVLTRQKTVFSLDSVRKQIAYLWEYEFYQMNNTLRYKLACLEKNKSLVPLEVYDILKADCYYNTQIAELNEFYKWWERARLCKDSTERRSRMRAYYQGYFESDVPGLFYSVAVKKISKYYIDFQSSKLLTETFQMNQNNAYCVDLISAIGKTETALQQKLTASLIAELGSGSEKKGFDSLVRYGLATITDPFLKRITDNFFETAIKGSPGYPFHLADDQGQMKSFNNFKGKTVLLDFWFTGCGACVSLATALKEVKEYFSKDTSVVFISISADKDRETWTEGLHSGMYTDNKSVNLYTMGEGQHHDLLNYYHINGYPKLMIFDKRGKLFAYNAPRADALGGIPQLISAITEAKMK